MFEVYLTLAILAGTVWLFVTEKVPATLVALIAMSVLTVTGLAGIAAGVIDPSKWITTRDILTSFSNPAVVAVASMFVLSGALESSGAVDALARGLALSARYRITLLITLIVVSAGLSAFVNNTAVVATLLPAVITLCARKRFPTSKFLIPLSYASQFGGVCTIIGTTTNLLGNQIARDAGLKPFGFFEFAPAGLIMLGVGTLYILLVGRFLLPEHPAENPGEHDIHPDDFQVELELEKGCPLAGKTATGAPLISEHDGSLRILSIERNGARIEPSGVRLTVGDRLTVAACSRAVEKLRRMGGVAFAAGPAPAGSENDKNDPLLLVRAVVAPSSHFSGLTLGHLRRHEWNRIAIVGVRRAREGDGPAGADTALEFGDTLLLLIRHSRMYRLRANPALIIIEERRHRPPGALTAWIAGAVFVFVMLASMLLGIPIETAALIGAVVCVSAGCIRLDDAVRAIDWKVILLLAGLLPLGLNLEKSGAAALAAEGVLRLTGDLGPMAMLALVYLVTAVMTEFMSNNASAVLLAPVAITAAVKLGADPRPFVVAVLFAASTSFATPVGYQTNAMVYGPGGYRFRDFIKIGLPLNLTFWGLAVWVIPKFWPF